jgi:two-component system, OmpR family, response regulator MprA
VRILVADDEEAVRTAVRRALTLAGYEVELVADGDEALASLAERAPDAILLDIMMPGVDGIEVCRRLRAVSMSTGAQNGDEAGVLRFDDLTLDLAGHVAERGGRQIELTRTEFQLLELFMRNPRVVLTRSVIQERVWGYDFGPTSNSLGVYVGYLRRKLEDGGAARLIHTVRGVGYVLRDA